MFDITILVMEDLIMKKIWNARKDSEGVSPVIATILMVAITVVLAAILMVMVMGMTGDGGQSVVATINAPDTNTTATSLVVTVTSIIPSTATTDITFTVNGAAAAANWGGATTVVSGSQATLTHTALAAGPATVQMLVDGTVVATKTITVTTAV